MDQGTIYIFPNEIFLSDVEIINDEKGSIQTNWYQKRSSGRIFKLFINHAIFNKVGTIGEWVKSL